MISNKAYKIMVQLLNYAIKFGKIKANYTLKISVINVFFLSNAHNKYPKNIIIEL